VERLYKSGILADFSFQFRTVAPCHRITPRNALIEPILIFFRRANLRRTAARMVGLYRVVFRRFFRHPRV